MYQVYAAAPAGSNATVFSSPLNITLWPGPASVAYSTFKLSATNPVLGANVSIEVDLKDVYNNRVESPGGECVLKVAGESRNTMPLMHLPQPRPNVGELCAHCEEMSVRSLLGLFLGTVAL